MHIDDVATMVLDLEFDDRECLVAAAQVVHTQDSVISSGYNQNGQASL